MLFHPSKTSPLLRWSWTEFMAFTYDGSARRTAVSCLLEHRTRVLDSRQVGGFPAGRSLGWAMLESGASPRPVMTKRSCRQSSFVPPGFRLNRASRIGPLWVMSQGITATPDAPPGPGSAGAATVSPDAETRAAAKTPPKTIESNSRRKVITGKDLAAAPNVLCVQFRSASGSPILWPRALKRMRPFLRR